MSKNLIIILVVLLVVGIGTGIYFSQKGAVSEKKEIKEEIPMLEKKTIAKEKPIYPIYKGATEFELSSEMKEEIRKGSEFPESTQITAYNAEDTPNQIYHWYQQELKKEGWEVIDTGEKEDMLWRKDDKILMIGVIPAEEAKEVGIAKNLILHMTDKYSNWEDFLLEEFGIIPGEEFPGTEKEVSEWVSPTGYNDPKDKWIDEALAYDDDLETYAYVTTDWSAYLELTYPSIRCSKIRFFIDTSYYDRYISLDIDVYYGGVWHPVVRKKDYWFSKYNNWIEESLKETYDVTKVRIQVRGGGWSDEGKSGDVLRLKEFDFGK